MLNMKGGCPALAVISPLHLDGPAHASGGWYLSHVQNLQADRGGEEVK